MSLDPRHQLIVMNLLREAAKRGGAVLGVVHDLARAGRFFDRVIVMAKGRLIDDAPPAKALPPKDVAAILALGADQRTPAQKDALRKHFRSTAAEFAELRGRLDGAKKAKADFEASLPRCIVSVSGNPRTVRILPRGN